MNSFFAVLLLFAFASACQKSPEKKISAAHFSVARSGRIAQNPDSSIRLFSSAAYLALRFSGKAIHATISDEFRDGTSYNWFSVRVDGKFVNRFRTERQTNNYLLASELSSGTHLLELIKDTEGQNGWVDVHSFTAHDFLEKPDRPNRKIEFIGNSVTCGMGALLSPIPCDSAMWFDQHLASRAFGVLTARALEADYLLASVSGMGVYRNWNSLSPIMPDRYTSITTDYAQGDAWDFSQYQPDVMVIGLGTNDFSDGDGIAPREPFSDEQFVQAYSNLLLLVAEKNPTAALFCTSSPMLESWKNDKLQTCITTAITNFKMTHPHRKIAFFRFQERYVGGCSSHPSADEHVKMAAELTPALAEFAGWKE